MSRHVVICECRQDGCVSCQWPNAVPTMDLPVSLPAAAREIAQLKAKLAHCRAHCVATKVAQLKLRYETAPGAVLGSEIANAWAEKHVAAAERDWDKAGKDGK